MGMELRRLGETLDLSAGLTQVREKGKKGRLTWNSLYLGSSKKGGQEHQEFFSEESLDF
jgi:hypothetical protein